MLSWSSKDYGRCGRSLRRVGTCPGWMYFWGHGNLRCGLRPARLPGCARIHVDNPDNRDRLRSRRLILGLCLLRLEAFGAFQALIEAMGATETLGNFEDRTHGRTFPSERSSERRPRPRRSFVSPSDARRMPRRQRKARRAGRGERQKTEGPLERGPSVESTLKVQQRYGLTTHQRFPTAWPVVSPAFWSLA